MNEKLLSLINKKLEVIIALLLRLKSRETETPTLREQIKILSGLRLSPKEIADILGRSNIYISKELSELRKVRKIKK